MQEPDDAVTLTSLFSHGRKLFTGEMQFYFPYGNAMSKIYFLSHPFLYLHFWVTSIFWLKKNKIAFFSIPLGREKKKLSRQSNYIFV